MRSSQALRADGKISATTRLTAIFGDPVGHSLSPLMHNAAYAALGMDRRYVAFHVTPDALVAAIHGIAALGILGVNLTVPHKERGLRVMDEVSAEGRQLGAINCVINRGGRLVGDNTDARGLERDLRTLGIAPAGKTAIVIGAGGAAAAAALAMIRLRAARVIVANRTRSRASALVRRFNRVSGGKPRFEHAALEALEDSRIVGESSCVVNATSMGLTTRQFVPIDFAATPRDCFFYDMLYARERTPFLAGASRAGRKHADGAGMLAEQGELAFKLFNRIAPPKGVMRQALMRALNR